MKKDLQSKAEQVTRRSFLREGAAAVGGLTVVSGQRNEPRAERTVLVS